MKKNFPKDIYFVAVKVFLEDKKGNFLITKDKFGDWDIPGGRLRTNDFAVPLEKVVARKTAEELGNRMKYKLLGGPVVFMRHERNEILEDGSRAKRRIFALGYRARLTSGEITPGQNHTQILWTNKKNFQAEKYLKGGWLKGVREYLKMFKK